MRQIKFRGKRIDQDEWVVGSLVKIIRVNIKFYILPLNTVIDDDSKMFDSLIEIRPETASQFTGLVDRNGKEIYEGDIIEDKNGIGVIMWFQTAWGVASYAHGYNGVKSYTAVDSFYCNEVKEWAVIGNIYDNPELLNENQ